MEKLEAPAFRQQVCMNYLPCEMSQTAENKRRTICSYFHHFHVKDYGGGRCPCKLQAGDESFRAKQATNFPPASTIMQANRSTDIKDITSAESP
jgi:hypothetical protein